MILATLCYVRHQGKTLMLHRIKKANDMHAGKWNGLGGKFERGETPEECAIREIEEESGLVVKDPRLRGLLTFPAFNDDVDWYAFVFTVEQFTGQLIDSPEGVLAWIDDDEVLALNLWEGDRIFLRWLTSDRFFSGKFSYIDGGLAVHSVVFHPTTLVDQETALARESDNLAGPEPFQPIYRPEDDQLCWVCDGPAIKRHCKIICQACGFTRDCSDP